MKYSRSQSSKLLSLATKASLAVALSAAVSTSAAVFVWDGGGATDNWTEDANWNLPEVSANTTDLQFAGSIRPTPNLTGLFVTRSVVFNAGASAFTLGGSGSLRLGGVGVGGVTNNTVGVKQTINLGLLLSSAQTWDAAAGDLTFGGLTAGLGGNILTLAGANVFVISNVLTGTTAGGLVKNGTGITTLFGANTYAGFTTVNDGTLQAGAANRFSAASAFTIANSGTLNLNGHSQVIASLAGSGSVMLGSGTLTAGGNNTSTTFTGETSGTGSLTKAGTGNFTLARATGNSYSGGTIVNGGTLTVNNAAGSATGSGNVTINTGGTFAGAGIIAGDLVLNSGSKVAPGLSSGTIGTLSVGSSTWNGGGTYVVDLASATGAPGVASDLILSTGALTGNASSLNTFVINVVGNPTGFNGNQNYSWMIASFDGGLGTLNTSSFSVSTVNFLGNMMGGTFAVDLQGNQFVNLTFTAVPEPSTVALGALGGVGLAAGMIRRRAKK